MQHPNRYVFILLGLEKNTNKIYLTGEIPVRITQPIMYKEIESQASLLELLNKETHLTKFAFQNLDFKSVKKIAKTKTFSDCLFLGCTIPKSLEKLGIKEKCIVFPKLNMPYNAFINKLYTAKDLYDNYELGNPNSYEKTHDRIVYNHYLKTGKEADDIKETTARWLHDHAITDALYDFLAPYDEKRVIAIMGGHSLSRADKNFLEVAKISKQLTEMGYLMISGGGPGAMEATHVGAWFAENTIENLEKAVAILAKAPIYNDEFWLDKSFEVLKLFPNTKYKSLGIPTWLYGHEPPTPFATHIAKYFANSVREDKLLAIAKGGIIFAPGSAGTIQEIFQDATQNHYLSFGYASPMIFFNTQYWNVERPIYPLLKQMQEEGKYKNLILSSYDKKEDVIAEIESFVK